MITGNSAPSGGGIFIAVSILTIGAGTVISNNDAYKTSTLPQGGGVCNSSSDITGSAAVKDNTGRFLRRCYRELIEDCVAGEMSQNPKIQKLYDVHVIN